MICENCGAEIRDGEEYCSNCGMELFTPKSNRKPVSKKPLKERYIDGEYQDQEDYEDIYESYRDYDEPTTPRKRNQSRSSYESNYGYEDYEPAASKKSSGMGATVIILLAALIIGFVIGIMVFSGNSQIIPSIKVG
ncbi:zinc ribbon domain-containing protein [Methanobacterium aggregans]|uniref:zinc ribbon domain-containing protein n=1 Tax=Methanobacterium aggregans TaxID=1615586 RepID=UPI001AEA2CC4|nr:zinc ribbon domain-containing protein [Methanobacterium aggregans]MBP2045598.1 putative nucleic acid-binding Zn-ribbon protein [Methanobacterium aggregans]